jgi:PIN domain nuclease of toxin-antitoxin system
MKVLLDTHTLLWFIANSPQLSNQALDIMGDQQNEILVSVASLWEIAIKHSLGKLELIRPFADLFPHQLDLNNFSQLSITIPQLIVLDQLPYHHRDPFDRILIAQSIAENAPLISVDSAFAPYPVTTIW